MNIKEEIKKLLQPIVLHGEIELSAPPKPEMGDLAFACFGLAKEMKKSPVEVAKELAKKINQICHPELDSGSLSTKIPDQVRNDNLVSEVKAFGPYVNFFLNAQVLAKDILIAAEKKDFGESKIGKGKKIMVEFAHPNTHKAFHIGHLRNITTGESVSRIFSNAGYKVIRANYQGDIGLHIAKCMWGIARTMGEYEATKKKTVEEKAKFLGRVYALGGQAYEKDEVAKKEIVVLNEKIYSGVDKKLNKIYKETRKWSLDYFETIYKRVGARFERLYFESETFARGRELALQSVKKGILKESDGAVIFEGEKYGLHSRVFLNSKGLPTYEAKDLALAELQLKEYNPEVIFHLVAKEQTEYFRVIFKALEFVLPQSVGRESHLVYGWVSLKEGKMSSRTGNVVLGEWLLDEVKNKVTEVMQEHELANNPETIEKIAVAAVKYMFLRTSTVNDIIFSVNESVNLTGDSGPYLLYIVARVNSIFKKLPAFAKAMAGEGHIKIKKLGNYNPEPAEKNLLMTISAFPEVTLKAATERDPSKIAHYLLELAQSFNNFYNLCPVLKTEGDVLNFRLHLIRAVQKVMTEGLYLLGIETVESM